MDPGLTAAKHRLIRGAVEDNLKDLRPGGPRATRGRGVRAIHLLPALIASACLIGSLVYLSVPVVPVVPPVPEAAADTPRSTAVPEPEVPGEAPKRLARGVLPLAVTRVAIDAGHGGSHTGAISASGVMEKHVTLEIAQRLARRLAAASLEVVMIRDADTELTLEERVARANASRADVFVSIHVNWLPVRALRPLETFYAGPTDDGRVLALARDENRESNYPLAEYRRLLEKVYLDARRQESRALARAVSTELYRALSPANPALENRGVKTAPFAVLLGTEMPAILVEVSCLSNEDEVELVTSADYQERIAAGLHDAIQAYARELAGGGRREG